MTPRTVERLEKLNRAFYTRHAETFSRTRTAPWPGWKHVESLSAASVLDLGCGNGRYYHFLSKRGFAGEYLGTDSCPELVERAAAAFPATNARWHVEEIHDALRRERVYDHIVAWGVLHHIPGEARRLALIEKMLSRLGASGSLWFSLWQFRDHSRFEKNECDPEDFGFRREELEEGDALLDWQGERSVPRYCHHFSREEQERLGGRFADFAPEFYRSESSSDRFNTYVRMHR